MSTRCNIHFTYDGRDKVLANVYRHSDGYPDGVLPDLDKFFAAVEDQTEDTRFNDPTYLAAKYVVWQAGEYARYGDALAGGRPAPLAFLGVGVTTYDAGDGEYVYTVACKSDGRPEVTSREAE